MAVAMRYLVTSIDPVTLALIRTGAGVLCLLPPALLAPGPRFARRDLLPIALLGVMFFALFSPGFATALKYTTATRAATEMALAPIATLLTAAAFGREPLTRNKLFGALLSFAGVAVVVGESVSSNPAQETLRGDAIVLGLVCLIALFNTLSRPFLQRYPPVRVTTCFMACGWLAMFSVALAADWIEPFPQLSALQWLVLIYLCTVVSAVPSFLYHWALGKIEAGQVTVTLGLNPVSAAFFGVLLLSEPLAWQLLAGLVLVLAGIYLSARPLAK